jgi:hypothetical protein
MSGSRPAGGSGRDGFENASLGAHVDLLEEVRDVLRLAVLYRVDEDLGLSLPESLVIEDLDQPEHPLHVGIGVHDDELVRLRYVDEDGVGGREGVDQLQDFR